MPHHLGIDVGATHLRAAVATEDLDIIGRSTTPTPQTSNGTLISDELTLVVKEACDDGGIDSNGISAVGIGAIGPIDQDAGVILNPANISENVGQIQLTQSLSELLQTDRIILHNDAVFGVIGELNFAASATENMIYLTISTGIGAGVVDNGDVIFGHDGNAGEVGHMTIDSAEEMVCQCGSSGHWEAYCSGANIPRYAAYLHHEEKIETKFPVKETEFTAEDLFDSVGEDKLADLVIKKIGYWNTIGFANIIQAFAPSYVAVGGAVALNNPNIILDPVRRHISERVMIDVPQIQLTELGEDAVLKGALHTAQCRFKSDDTGPM